MRGPISDVENELRCSLLNDSSIGLLVGPRVPDFSLIVRPVQRAGYPSDLPRPGPQM